MKKHYVVYETTYFIDPHGAADTGETIKTVEYTDRFDGLDSSLTYDDELEPLDDDRERYGSEDGYNSTDIEINFREVTEDEYNRIKVILTEYNKI
jgi:hypothetical protein